MSRLPKLLLATVVFATTFAGLLAGQTADRYRLVEEARWGSADDPELALSRIGRILVSEDGLVYVAQPDEPAIRVFDPDGRAVGRIGRRGEGPGEFRSLDGIGWLSGRLWAADPSLGRIQVFSRSGEVVQMNRTHYAPHGARLPSRLAALLADGSAIAVPVGVLPGEEPEAVPVARIAATGELIEAQLFTLRWASFTDEITTPDGLRASLIRPVHFNSLWAVSPSGRDIVVVDRPRPRRGVSARYTISVLTPTGALLRTRSYDYEPVPIERSTAARLRAETPASLAGYSARMFRRDSAQIHRALAEAMTIATHQAAVDRVFVTNDRRIFLRRGAAGMPDAAWIVLNEGGDVIGSFVAPAALELHAASGSTVWGASTDELGVPHLARFRLVRER